MTKFIVRELQNANSTREGSCIEAKNISLAKRAASKAQCFFGTILVIESENGEVLSTKTGKTWVDA